MNSGDLLPLVLFNSAKSLLSDFHLHGPSEPTPRVLEADLENESRLENSKFSFWQHQVAIIPEPSNVARDYFLKKSTDEGESNHLVSQTARE